jgi:hypothetical protein
MLWMKFRKLQYENRREAYRREPTSDLEIYKYARTFFSANRWV